MTHNKLENIEILGGLENNCDVELMEPNPSMETIVYAQSLDRRQKNSKGLGVKFAQKVIVNC